ncbi:MAG TPA: DUF2723 domain-containing protein [Acidobacteriota bacterium]|nr:DUF2723 domain-containing protein [Acidobacteriota bacterium]
MHATGQGHLPPGLSYVRLFRARVAWATSGTVVVLSVVVYWLTAFRTFTWWNSAEYSLAAVTLGTPSPPGSLLVTVLGWIVTKLPLGIPDLFRLNLFAAAAAAITVGLVSLIATERLIGAAVQRRPLVERRSLITGSVGVAVGALTFAFSQTLWTYAVKLTPYVFTALFTALILWALFRWSERAYDPSAARRLFLVTLLFGLDLSVHRTNFLLFPGLFVWVLLGNPRTYLSIRSWLYGFCGLVLGLAGHLLLIPLAARNPFLNMADPSNWSRFYDYVSLRMAGGGWLVELYPRKADFLQVQVMDWVNGFAANFCTFDSSIVPALLALVGLVWLWRRNWRPACGLTVLFLLSSLGAVVYFNVPADFFRSMYRHYLPSFVIISVWIACGAGAIVYYAARMTGRLRVYATMLAVIVIAVAAGRQVKLNFAPVDGSNRSFAYDFAMNVFESLPEKAIVFVAGDNDTFPLWCLQGTRGVRPDVTVVNLPLLNTSWYVKQLVSRDSTFPLSSDDLSAVVPLAWRDTTITVPTGGDPTAPGLSDETAVPDSVYFQVPPSFQSGVLMGSDRLILRMISQNRWQRPVFFAITTGSQFCSWVQPYLRLEGLVRRLVPVSDGPAVTGPLRENVLSRYVYNGYADSAVWLDDVSRSMAVNYYAGFIALATAEKARGDTAACQEVRRRMLELLPPDRLVPPPNIRRLIDVVCGRDEPG